MLEDDVIVDIPATVRSIVPNMTQDGALILFEATGAEIADIGGIASGMSGSPLYVDIEGTDKLVGAVAYGEVFTLDNLGLATPIEYMTAIQDRYLVEAPSAASITRTTGLAAPVRVDGTTVRRVAVAPSRRSAVRLKAAEGSAVFAPLTVVEVGGLNSRTAAYKAAAAKLESMGLDVVTPPKGMSAGYDPAWSAALTGGASMAALYARGDYWAGSAGTVTYVDGATLLGFGHPLGWAGDTELYLTNALVSGIWKSAISPHKLMAPAALRGTITQDRNSGVAGPIGPVPADTVVDAAASLGSRTETSSSTVVRSLASSSAFNWLPADACSIPVYRALDSWSLVGSASATITIVVNDGAQDLAVVRENVYDSSEDVSFAPIEDIYTILETLTANADGIAPVSIKSVTFDSDFSRSRRSARIVSVAAPDGLHTGTVPNDIQVTLAVYGQAELETYHVPLLIPAGTSLRGELVVRGYGEGFYFDEDVFLEAAAAAGDDRQSVEELVASLNAEPANDSLVVEFYSETSTDAPDAAASEQTGWVVSGERSMWTSKLVLRASPATVGYGASTMLWGWVEGPSSSATVDIYAQALGSATRTLLASVPAVAQRAEPLVFEYEVPRVVKNTTYTAVWAGDEEYLGSKRSVAVVVRPWVGLSASPASFRFGSSTVLTARVLPVLPARTATFQRRTSSGSWVYVTRGVTNSQGRVVKSWKPRRVGTFVMRAVAGTGKSRTFRITVRP